MKYDNSITPMFQKVLFDQYLYKSVSLVHLLMLHLAYTYPTGVTNYNDQFNYEKYKKRDCPKMEKRDIVCAECVRNSYPRIRE